jgi:hypothetical protein
VVLNPLMLPPTGYVGLLSEHDESAAIRPNRASCVTTLPEAIFPLPAHGFIETPLFIYGMQCRFIMQKNAWLEHTRD